MGKRPPLVVLSSSSDDDGGGGRCTASRGPSTRRTRTPATAPPAKQAPSSSRKKPRRGSSGGRGRRRASGIALSGSLKAGSMRQTEELWIDKYKPLSSGELAVHKKKVEDVKNWLEEKLKAPKGTFGGRSLVLTGQAGVGKSATVKAIAAEIGADLCEWTTPVPTLWAELVHANSELEYVSKLEEFENFVNKIRKYSLLSPTSIGSQRKLIIILIDDIPVTSGKASFARLGKCLTGLIQSTQIPTVISLTHHHKNEANDTATWNTEELESLLQGAGAHKIVFNPVTVSSIKKILLRICKQESSGTTEELVHQIATSCGGDIRHAIMSLQYYCLNPRRLDSALAISASLSELKGHATLAPAQDCYGLGSVIHSPCGRDETLTLFHALGKFLHNKRETHGDVNIDLDSFSFKEQLRRNPLKMDVPEMILSQAHGEVRTVADFLHENVVDFIDDDAVDDAWVVMSYLSEADCLLAGSPIASARWTVNESNESENMSQLIAASVAARGVLFGNAHPSPSRWHTIRSPKVWQIERTFRSTKGLILKERFDPSSTSGSRNFSVVVTDFRPFERWISPHNDMTRNNPSRHDVAGGPNSIDMLDAEGNNSEEEEEDEIEEW
ncbi:cell cycle checkpoint protein RAD17 isoform X2 [Aegilops tauschii subsp. strangulata]|uniref:cell cycle checkpoint protein RAD17 isoform X2 n=1 Tax=Aegilops tauschii subsp. strangulata TaxID=200361 RepID=UPI001ABCE6AD|nr:cell cycle checkpoint protein RAD17 isoform X2 [Aegilops tauschii subsp. strangulata]